MHNRILLVNNAYFQPCAVHSPYFIGRIAQVLGCPEVWTLRGVSNKGIGYRETISLSIAAIC